MKKSSDLQALLASIPDRQEADELIAKLESMLVARRRRLLAQIDEEERQAIERIKERMHQRRRDLGARL